MFQQIKNLLKSNLFKHISTVFLWDNIAKFFGIITTVILIRMLSKGDYALYTFFWAAAMFFVGFVTSGIDMAYVRFAAEEYSAEKKVPNDIFIFSIILCSSIFLILFPLILIFSKQLSLLMFKGSLYSKPIFLGFLAAIGLFFVTIASRYYQVQERYPKAGVIISFQKFLFLLCLSMIIFIKKLDFLIVAYIQIIIMMMLGLSLIIIILKNNLIKERFILRFSRFTFFLNASFWLIMYFISLALFSQLDIFMISRLMPINDLANYGVAFKYYGFLLLMFPAIKTVLKVETSKIEMVTSVEKQRDFIKKWIKVMTLFSIPIIILIILFSDILMNLLNGPKYVESIMPFKILAVSAAFSYILAPNTDIFRAMKKYFLLFCFGFIALIANFFGNLLLIPVLGITGAAIATLFSHLFINSIATVYVIYLK